ncbi:hypothetical protein FRC02_003985 [Tulasnella sp. 418]|nr:hypothetical protein FRC02_003985 [Tulasnella sp. 418]
MDSFNALVLQLQIMGGSTPPAGTVPVQGALYLAIAFGRDPKSVFADQEVANLPNYLDHATFIRTVRRLLPLDESGGRSEYRGTACKEDLRGLLKAFGREPYEVDDYLLRCVPEDQVNFNKFIRILAKPIAGQRYPIGVYTVSRPLDSPTSNNNKVRAILAAARRPRSSSTSSTSTTSSSRSRQNIKAGLGISSTASDPMASALAKRIKFQRLHRSRHQRSSSLPSSLSSSYSPSSQSSPLPSRRNSTDAGSPYNFTRSSSPASSFSTPDFEPADDISVLSYRLCVMELR